MRTSPTSDNISWELSVSNVDLTAPISELSEIDTIGVVVAQFNSHITQELEKGALEELIRKGVSPQKIQLVRVPGAYEIPLVAQMLIQRGCNGIIGLGAVIRGETPHFDYVCAGSERGCMDVQLKTGVPVIFGVLTVNTLEQAKERIGGKHGHKGVEAAETLARMVCLTRLLEK